MILSESSDPPLDFVQKIMSFVFSNSKPQQPLELSILKKSEIENEELMIKLQELVNGCISWNANDRPSFNFITKTLQTLLISVSSPTLVSHFLNNYYYLF